MPTEPEPITLAALVRRAAEIVDPEDRDSAVGDLERHYEDADEPVTAIESLEERLAWDPSGAQDGGEPPAVAVALAIVLYLAHRRDQVEDDDVEIVRLAVRAEWGGEPPAPVGAWLAEVGAGA